MNKKLVLQHAVHDVTIHSPLRVLSVDISDYIDMTMVHNLWNEWHPLIRSNGVAQCWKLFRRNVFVEMQGMVLSFKLNNIAFEAGT